MNWIVISIFAYFLVSLEVILDKFLLSSKRVSHPAVYTFYSGLLSLGALLIFAPFGFHRVDFSQGLLSLLAGAVFAYGILSLFFAISKSEASQVTPIVGATIPLVTFSLSIFFLEEKLTAVQAGGVAALVIGGLLISFDFPLRINKNKFFSGFYQSLLAGLLLAVAFTWFKRFYEHDNFINVFIWTRLGLCLGAVSLLFVSGWRRSIFNSFRGVKNPAAKNYSTGVIFVVNKALGGLGSILTNFAISLGSVTIVNALVSTEYMFVLLLGILFSVRFPGIFQEKRDSTSIMEKVLAIIIITVGIVMISAHFR